MGIKENTWRNEKANIQIRLKYAKTIIQVESVISRQSDGFGLNTEIIQWTRTVLKSYKKEWTNGLQMVGLISEWNITEKKQKI